MTDSTKSELECFHRFVGKLLASQVPNMVSPEAAITLWREEQESLRSIQEGLDDIAAGRTKSVAQFDRDFRERHGLN